MVASPLHLHTEVIRANCYRFQCFVLMYGSIPFSLAAVFSIFTICISRGEVGEGVTKADIVITCLPI